jgi:hypothetical protein
MSVERCSQCGARLTPDHRGTLRCERCLRERIQRDCDEQGIPFDISDESVLRFVADRIEAHERSRNP